MGGQGEADFSWLAQRFLLKKIQYGVQLKHFLLLSIATSQPLDPLSYAAIFGVLEPFSRKKVLDKNFPLWPHPH